MTFVSNSMWEGARNRTRDKGNRLLQSHAANIPYRHRPGFSSAEQLRGDLEQAFLDGQAMAVQNAFLTHARKRLGRGAKVSQMELAELLRYSSHTSITKLAKGQTALPLSRIVGGIVQHPELIQCFEISRQVGALFGFAGATTYLSQRLEHCVDDELSAHGFAILLQVLDYEPWDSALESQDHLLARPLAQHVVKTALQILPETDPRLSAKERKTAKQLLNARLEKLVLMIQALIADWGTLAAITLAALESEYPCDDEGATS